MAEDLGWASVPPGTRKSTYENPDYQKAAPFAAATLKAMETADPTNPCIVYAWTNEPDLAFQELTISVDKILAGLHYGQLKLDPAGIRFANIDALPNYWPS